MTRTAFLSLVLLIPLSSCNTDTSSKPDAPAPRYVGAIERLDTRLEALVPSGARPEILADGFDWTEGPVWRRDGGYLLFNDIPPNTMYRWSESDGLRIFMRPAGYTGPDPPGNELGANGLAFDSDGALVLCDHGNRNISRLDETKFTKTILVDRYGGKRLNSPNDLAFKSNGDLYFTDPPYGLRGLNDDPHKELSFNGVYRLSAGGKLTLLVDDLTFPNGIAFSPDEKTLYVSNSNPKHAVWMAYDVLDDGSVANGRIFFDATDFVVAGKKGLPDGMTVDAYGNLFGAGPGGVLIFAPDGTHLGTIETGQATANVSFGGNGQTLFITADMFLLRIDLTTKGIGF